MCCHTAELAHCAIDAIIKAVESGKVSRETLASATRRCAVVRTRYEKPVGSPAGLDALRSPEHLAVVTRILTGMDAGLSQVGSDPTEVMERIQAERERASVD